VRTVQVSVGNGRFYGGGMTVENTAQPDDGRLDVYSLEIRHWSQLLALLPSLRRGTHGRWKNVRAFGTVELTLRTPREHEVNADGDLVTTTPAHFQIRHAAVSVFVPAGPTQGTDQRRGAPLLLRAELDRRRFSIPVDPSGERGR
jgi:diacylglycerol kinase (ATP)